VVISVLERARGKVSGAVVDHPFIHVWTIRDGRGTTLRSFADREDAVRYAHGEES
jgi:ketosteroid isomerase-like protein